MLILKMLKGSFSQTEAKFIGKPSHVLFLKDCHPQKVLVESATRVWHRCELKQSQLWKSGVTITLVEVACHQKTLQCNKLCPYPSPSNREVERKLFPQLLETCWTFLLSLGPVYSTPKELDNTTITDRFGFVVDESSGREIIAMSSFSKGL